MFESNPVTFPGDRVFYPYPTSITTMTDTNEETKPVDYLNLDENEIKGKSEEELMHDAVAALEESFSHRGNPVHRSHKNVDEVRNEMKRRGKENLFNTAFREFDRRTSGEPEDQK